MKITLICHSCESRNPVSFSSQLEGKAKTLDPRSGSGMTERDNESVHAFVNDDYVQDKKAAA